MEVAGVRNAEEMTESHRNQALYGVTLTDHDLLLRIAIEMCAAAARFGSLKDRSLLAREWWAEHVKGESLKVQEDDRQRELELNRKTVLAQ